VTGAVATASFLDALKAAAAEAEAAGGFFRREAAGRFATLGRERAFAFRRLNLMRAVAEAVVECDSEEIAVAAALAVVRSRLGWNSDSEARTQVLSRFAAVAQAMFDYVAAPEDASASVYDALSRFETWYAEHHQTPFWALFEHYVAETPLVDF